MSDYGYGPIGSHTNQGAPGLGQFHDLQGGGAIGLPSPGLSGKGWLYGQHLDGLFGRVGSAGWDYGVLGAVPLILAPVVGFPMGACLFLVALAWVANSIVIQGLTGTSLGRWAMDERLVCFKRHPFTGVITLQAPGIGACVVRQLGHLIDGAIGFGIIGMLCILVNEENQTIGDRWASTYVVNTHMSADDYKQAGIRL